MTRARRSCLIELRLPRTLLVLGYGAALGHQRRGAASVVRQPARHRPTSAALRAARRWERCSAAIGLASASRWRSPSAAQPGALGDARLLLRPRRSPRRHAPRCCSPAWPFRWRGRRDQPGAGARPLALRILRRVRLADGQRRRPQPGASAAALRPGRLACACSCDAPRRSTCSRLAKMSPPRSGTVRAALRCEVICLVGHRGRRLRRGRRRDRFRRAGRTRARAGD